MKLVVHAGLKIPWAETPVSVRLRPPLQINNKMKDVKLDLTRVQVPRENSNSIEDMERMFGRRIKRAINSEPNENGRIYRAIVTKKMAKIIKPWKFWNADIRKAYKNYVGMVLVPWVIVNEPPIITYESPETGEIIKRKIDMSRYIVTNIE